MKDLWENLFAPSIHFSHCQASRLSYHGNHFYLSPFFPVRLSVLLQLCTSCRVNFFYLSPCLPAPLTVFFPTFCSDWFCLSHSAVARLHICCPSCFSLFVLSPLILSTMHPGLLHSLSSPSLFSKMSLGCQWIAWHIAKMGLGCWTCSKAHCFFIPLRPPYVVLVDNNFSIILPAVEEGALLVSLWFSPSDQCHQEINIL